MIFEELQKESLKMMLFLKRTEAFVTCRSFDMEIELNLKINFSYIGKLNTNNL